MATQSRKSTGVLLIALLGIGVMLAMNRSERPQIEDRITPAVEVISFGATGVAKFETSTGAIWRLNGDTSKPNVRAEWVLHTPGVGNRAPGSLRIQQPEPSRLGATFLVDVATGETWILRERGSGHEGRLPRFEWEAVRDFR